MRKKIFFVIWGLGMLMLFMFRTPVKYFQFYDRYIVIYTHIFSNRGKILAGQLVLYIAIWSAFVVLTYWLFVFLKKHE